MLFLADAMLGKLARWLRILGYDTTYYPSLSDDEIEVRLREEGRVLITRDVRLHGLVSRQGLRSILIRQDDLDGMLLELSTFLADITPGSRCPSCNGLLVEADCPERCHKHLQCWRCPSCGKLYWHGAHWKGIRRTLVLAGLGDRIGDS